MAMVNHVRGLQMAHSGTRYTDIANVWFALKILWPRYTRKCNFIWADTKNAAFQGKMFTKLWTELWADLLYEISPKLGNNCR